MCFRALGFAELGLAKSCPAPVTDEPANKQREKITQKGPKKGAQKVEHFAVELISENWTDNYVRIIIFFEIIFLKKWKFSPSLRQK